MTRKKKLTVLAIIAACALFFTTSASAQAQFTGHATGENGLSTVESHPDVIELTTEATLLQNLAIYSRPIGLQDEPVITTSVTEATLLQPEGKVGNSTVPQSTITINPMIIHPDRLQGGSEGFNPAMTTQDGTGIPACMHCHRNEYITQ